MATYRFILRMTDTRQVDVETDEVLSPFQLQNLAVEKAMREFGDADEIEVESYEEVFSVGGQANHRFQATAQPLRDRP